MIISSDVSKEIVADASDATRFHRCECPVFECPQNYSPSLGYFVIGKNQDHWHVTGTSSLRIIRNPTQVLCGHKDQNIMFIQIFDAQQNVLVYRCPRRDCEKTVKIPADGPHASWLCDGFFGTA